MSIPRGVSGSDLIKAAALFGYETTRQSGSHVRLTTQKNGIHHITIPLHQELKVGTLNGILTDIAEHFSLSKKEVVATLFK
jgi:predicted RNA binding protein YcfA (HicA-like mRNA interferase family)